MCRAVLPTAISGSLVPPLLSSSSLSETLHGALKYHHATGECSDQQPTEITHPLNSGGAVAIMPLMQELSQPYVLLHRNRLTIQRIRLKKLSPITNTVHLMQCASAPALLVDILPSVNQHDFLLIRLNIHESLIGTKKHDQFVTRC